MTLSAMITACSTGVFKKAPGGADVDYRIQDIDTRFRLLILQGTWSYVDVLRDARMILGKLKEWPKGLAEIKEELSSIYREAITNLDGRQLFVIGHSLGGAEAQYIAAMFDDESWFNVYEDDMPLPIVVNFGGPKVVPSGVEIRCPILHVVHRCDPLSYTIPWRHRVGFTLWIGNPGRLRGTAHYLGSYMDELSTLLIDL